MLRVGIVGAGFIAKEHAKGYSKFPSDRAKLVAVADVNLDRAKELAESYHAKAVASIDELLDLDVDVISVCVPTPFHSSISIKAMKKGKHVLCEKPMARTVKEAEEMISVSKEMNVKLMIGQVSRYEADHLAARDVLLRGEIGKLYMATETITSAFPSWDTGWFSNYDMSGGPLLDLGIHSIDFLMWMFNEPVKRVYALGSRYQGDMPTYTLMTMRFTGGGIGMVEASWGHPPSHPFQYFAEFVGEEGRMKWGYDDLASMKVTKGDNSPEQMIMLGTNSFTREIEAFINCVEKDTLSPISSESALATLKVALAGIESLKTGKAILT
jgi:predicted dehydrogenase